MTSFLYSIASNTYYFLIYLVSQTLALLGGAIIWHLWISKNLFYNSDATFILDFIPPFVYSSQYGDYYLAPKNVVYFIWGGFLLTLILLPVAFLWQVRKEGRSGLKPPPSYFRVS